MMNRTVEAQGLQTDLLVIGYGNTLRSDDGVGPRVAEAVERLNLPGVTTRCCALLTPELAGEVVCARTVIFVDAAVGQTEPVHLRPLLPAASSQLTAHAAEPSVILALARDVFGHSPSAFLLSLAVEEMGIGESLSETAQEAVKRAVLKIGSLAPQICQP